MPKKFLKKDHGVKRAKALNRTVHFSYIDPTARQVCVAGTFNDWDPKKGEMALSSEGTWRKSIGLKKGIYEYRLVVDGRWMADPQAKHAVWNDRGEKNSLLTISDEDTEE